MAECRQFFLLIDEKEGDLEAQLKIMLGSQSRAASGANCLQSLDVV